MTTLWVLILFAHVGPMGSGNSNALASVTGFHSEAACIAAGNKAKDLASGTMKEIRFACAQL